MPNMVAILGLPFLTCVLMTLILSHLGIHILRREVIFIDIALAQTAAVGALAGHIFFGFATDSLLGYLCALGITLAAAGFYAIARRHVSQIPLEAVIGVTYAIAAAAALFLAGLAPGGHVHVKEVLAGSILWSTWQDIGTAGLVFAAVGLGFVLFRKPFNRLSDDYDRARADQMNVVCWDFLFYALLGMVVTLAVRTAGVVVVFSFLIIPATVSALLTSRWQLRLPIAWTYGIASSAAGLLAAYHYDFSVGPAIAAFLGLTLALTAAGLRVKDRIRRTAPCARPAEPEANAPPR
ncbi:MAG TPA: metal ABC transporter permease [Candidatus Hydrogenedentes bacterium]|nr:metal ABC transporter permease [Candidatus Hydrogenedentota bacterium]HIJ72495.1 metal ABC transporter permease [Candidatus Hydrogenedentota bacterium]